MNGEWGTVCNNNWNDNDAQTVCRQIGLDTSVAKAAFPGEFGQGSGPIFLDNVQCTGSETSIFDCSHNGIGISPGCDHSKDAGVKCTGKCGES